MGMERRDQQSLTLNRTTHRGSSTGTSGQIKERWLRISLKAQDKFTVFHNLLTHINVETLSEAYNAIDGSKALGVDKVSKEAYGKSLNRNLKNLENKIHKGTYRPKPKREIQIPKANGKTRPIAIACFEDKLVDHVVGKILSTVYEPLFIRNSFGFRPNKSAHNAINASYCSLKDNSRSNVVEIDFSSFFNTIPHKQLIEVLGKRISDNRFKGLIGRFLVGDLINSDGEVLPSEVGTPQGGIMSPILANIYLNEVIDQWFLSNFASYNNVIVRYADDAVFFFKKEADASKFMVELEKRVSDYGLSLNKEKTKIVNFSKRSRTSFNFLGFTFYWGKPRKIRGALLQVKTQKEKLIKSIQEFECWIKTNRSKLKTAEIWKLAKSKLIGHYNYFGYWMNRAKLNHFYNQAIKSLYKWLNRRSQLISYKIEEFKEKLKQQPLPEPPTMAKLKQLGRNPYAN
jgi:RNA-directed DNA polymerase